MKVAAVSLLKVAGYDQARTINRFSEQTGRTLSREEIKYVNGAIARLRTQNPDRLPCMSAPDAARRGIDLDKAEWSLRWYDGNRQLNDLDCALFLSQGHLYLFKQFRAHPNSRYGLQPTYVTDLGRVPRMNSAR